MKMYSIHALAVALATYAGSVASLAQTSGAASDAANASTRSEESKDLTDIKQLRASKLIGINVTSKDGDNLGQVQDLVIDPATGKIRFALVGQGFMAGAGQKVIPVPWRAVNIRSEREFALHVDKQKLASAPTWSPSDNMEQPDYIIRVYRFYEIEPQNDVGGLGSSRSDSGESSGSSADSKVNHPSDSSSHDHSPTERPSSSKRDAAQTRE